MSNLVQNNNLIPADQMQKFEAFNQFVNEIKKDIPLSVDIKSHIDNLALNQTENGKGLNNSVTEPLRSPQTTSSQSPEQLYANLTHLLASVLLVPAAQAAPQGNSSASSGLEGRDSIVGSDVLKRQASEQEFDISKLKSSQMAALFTIILQALQTSKAAERQNQADMAINQGKAVISTVDSIKASGVNAMSGGITSAVVSGGLAAGAFGLQNRANNMERMTIKNDNVNLMGRKSDLNMAQLKSSQGSSNALGTPASANNSGLRTQGGDKVSLEPNSPNIRSQHQAHIDEAAQHNLKRDIAATENEIQLKNNDTSTVRNQGNFATMMNNPATGIVQGSTQMNQTVHNANEYMSKQAEQSSASMKEASKENANGVENLIQSMLQTLQQMLQNSRETADLSASRTA